jgi:protein-S-isoprenylcysteine O-methyltransferase Ste14
MRTRGGRRASSLRRHVVDLAGVTVVALAARQALLGHLGGHRLIGVVFFVQQVWVAGAFLWRRPALVVSRRPLEWIAAYGGSFGGFLLRPIGLHPRWGLDVGLGLQVVGLVAWGVAFFALGRSFGLVPADRGLVTGGLYARVRHPLYTSYMLAQLGYLAQSISLWNVLVIAGVWTCQVVRALAEERLLGGSLPLQYDDYRARVRWRLLPGIW